MCWQYGQAVLIFVGHGGRFLTKTYHPNVHRDEGLICEGEELVDPASRMLSAR